MRRILFIIALCIVTVSLGSTALAAIESQTEAKQEPTSYDNFLKGLSNLQKWAVKLEAALRKQGAEIDRNKAKTQILPKVIAIQKILSNLEDINRRITLDAGTDAKSLNPNKMRADLNDLSTNLFVLRQRFREMREGVHVISIPEITEVERLGEDFVGARALEVDAALRTLGVSSGDFSEIDYANLKSHSTHITELLHKAQDAFGTLHRYLEN